ncbi:armadillo-type protein [Roridomyces roridus]|uniref:Armadillo-type protein n=1 Tax=Roridomyces roridus TaxID=1738132 RepID=A0AAD7BXQ5_9AGAR|nr:armadillo-type protein [Roridomyces roridus]
MQSLGNHNPGLNGPTINLHTMTKPLLRLMYHRQALEYIKNNELLTEAMLDIYSSYLECKYVASRTKLSVLSHLVYKSRRNIEEAQSVVDSSVFSAIPQLVESPNPHIRRESVKLINTLADHKSVVAPINALNQIADKMGLLLCDGNATEVKSAIHSLVRIAVWPLYNRALGYISDITVAFSDATVLDIYSSYLQSKHVASGTKVIILQFLRWEMASVLDLGAQSIVRSSAFSQILQLPESSNAEIRVETTRLIKALTSYDSFAAPTDVLNQVVEKLELTLHDKETDVVEALDSLIQIALWLPGAETLVASDALESTQELVASTNPELGIRAAVLVSTIACHSELEATMASTIEKIDPFGRIAFLLQHNETRVVRRGLFGLLRMARFTLGARRIMDTAALEFVFELLDSPDFWIQLDSCRLIAELSSHETILSKVLDANPLPKIVKLLCRGNFSPWKNTPYDAALEVLCQIASWKLGAETIFKTPGVLDTLSKREFRNSIASEVHAKVLRNLAIHKPELDRLTSANGE